MRFNKFNIISSLLLLATATSCETGDEALNSMADFTWHLSSDSDNRDPIILNEGAYLSMMDASQSELSHKWTLPDGGLYLFYEEVDDDEDYEDYIDYVTRTSTDKTIHVYFKEPGQYSINLYDTFPKEVRYPYEYTDDLGNTETRYLFSEEIDGEHVFSYDFDVDVYCKTMLPRVNVYRDAECTDLVIADLQPSSDPVDVEIEYGDILYFEDTSYDRPNYWEFICNEIGFSRSYTGSTYAGMVVPIAFKTATKIDGVDISDPLNVTLLIQRTDTSLNSGDADIPEASRVKEVLPLNITVVPTTADLSFDIVQIDKWTLEFQANNGEFKSDAVFTNEDLAKFSLTANNYYKYVEGTEQTTQNYYYEDVPITIQSIQVSSSDPTVLTIKLGDRTPIYNTDELYFSCSGEIEDKMEYGMVIKFADPIEPNITTTFSDIFSSDFETEASRVGWEAKSENPTAYSPYVMYADVDYDTACANPLPESTINNSAYCMRANYIAEGLSSAENFFARSTEFEAGAGTYTLSYKFYSPLAVSLIPFWSTTGFKYDASVEFAAKSFAGYTAQTDWYSVTHTITATSPTDIVTGLQMYLRIVGLPHNEDIYFDDFFFGYIEERTSTELSL